MRATDSLAPLRRHASGCWPLGAAVLLLGLAGLRPVLSGPAPPLPASAIGQPGARHPLDPLTEAELALAVGALRVSPPFPANGLFSSLALREPPKEEVLRWRPGIAFRREAAAVILDRRGNRAFEAVVDLARRQVVAWKAVPGAQPGLGYDDYAAVTRLVRADPRWQAAIRRRGIRDLEGVRIDAWGPGDLQHGEAPGARLARAVSYYRGTATNNYARPIEGIVATVDLTRERVLDVLDLGPVPLPQQTWDLTDAGIGRLRAAPRPLQIGQPQGPSWEVLGQEVRWQKWRFRFGVGPREGLVLHEVGYEDQGKVRPLLYRASLSEMVVPYADPGPAWAFRYPFDEGEYGVGRSTSSLVPGLDAPENARFFDAAFTTDGGFVYSQPRAVALYERDGGILWRHMEVETGVTAARRARELVLLSIATLGNYDYGFTWVFRQDGSLGMEILLTGIMHTKGVRAAGSGDHDAGGEEQYGHLVAPNVLAVSHQHFFNFRLDLDVDGPAPNTLLELDMRRAPPGPMNPAGNAFLMDQTPLLTERAARRDLDMAANRKWKVINPASRNGLGRPAGYLLFPGENSLAYGAPGSSLRRRAGFLDHHLWATRYDPGELFAAGTYVNQSRGGDGLPRWSNDDPLRDEDLVLWYTLGVTHLPRPEEWPVMPVHAAGFKLLPADFFDRNPALDVPRG